MKRRAYVIGIFPCEGSIMLVGVMVLTQNAGSQLRHRYLNLEALGDRRPACR